MATKRLFTLMVLLITIFIISFLGFYSKPIFCDFNIIFEGGYRLLYNQIPYRDFFIPMGPITYYIQAFFMLIFGNNLFSLYMHSCSLSLILCGFFYFLVSEKFNPKTGFIYSIFMFFSFNGMLNYPFYSVSEPFFFLLLPVIFILMFLEKIVFTEAKSFIFLLSIFTTLNIFTRQDIGLLQGILFCCFFLFVLDIKVKTIFKYYLVPVTIGCLGFVIFFSINGDFFHWFNWGQGQNNTRLQNLLSFSLFNEAHLYLMLIFGLLVTRKQLKYKPHLQLMIIVMGIILVSSNLTTTRIPILMQGIPIIIFVLHMTFHPLINQKLLLYLVFFSLVISTRSVPLMSRYIAGHLLFPMWSQHFKIDSRLSPRHVNEAQTILTIPELVNQIRNLRIPNYQRIGNGSYSDGLILKDNLDDLNKIKSIIAQHGGDFINLTEYQFLWADFNKEPIRGLPLAFDHGIFFQDDDIERIKTSILKENAKIVLIQDYLGHQDPSLHERFQRLLESHDYKLLRTFNGPTQKPIFLYIKNNHTVFCEKSRLRENGLEGKGGM